ncbi:MAG: hypothetical protein PUD89_03070 [Bacteroidales bacterium]|nr:hypothetical protein [Bacteroidales bacterium]
MILTLKAQRVRMLDGWTLEIMTNCEDFRAMLDMLRYTTQETLIEETFYNVPDFLQELMPDYETLAKMQND